MTLGRQKMPCTMGMMRKALGQRASAEGLFYSSGLVVADLDKLATFTAPKTLLNQGGPNMTRLLSATNANPQHTMQMTVSNPSFPHIKLTTLKHAYLMVQHMQRFGLYWALACTMHKDSRQYSIIKSMCGAKSLSN